MATTNLAYLMKPIRPKTVFLNHQGALIYPKMTSKKATKVLKYKWNKNNRGIFHENHVILVAATKL